MKKIIVCLFAIFLAVLGCKKEAAQPESDSAKAVKVLEEYFHRVGSGNLPDIEKFATNRGMQAAGLLYPLITDEQKAALKKFKADVPDENIADQDEFIFSVTLLDTPINVRMVKVDDIWKVDSHNWNFKTK